MITAVDTNVLIDVFDADAEFGLSSARAVRRCLGQGALVACEAVWAETAAHFAEPGDAEAALAKLRVEFSPLSSSAASGAGRSWRAYRRSGGSRDRVVPDFLVGAHALHQADRLLTRDRGFYRRYFEDLEILDPTA
ncbi:MAG TPA: type II toxin-antitoxin system VapC family toxin [Solirubrobacteraceae bacterium]|nr:type II toxin-antitoxin system VapC family toxin [Solirubrobacteraceae bacterium]